MDNFLSLRIQIASGKLDKLGEPIMKLPERIRFSGMGDSSFTNLSMSSFESVASEVFKSSSLSLDPRQILKPRSPFEIVGHWLRGNLTDIASSLF